MYDWVVYNTSKQWCSAELIDKCALIVIKELNIFKNTFCNEINNQYVIEPL